MPRGVNHAGHGTDGTKFYIFGGRTGGNSVSTGFDTVQIYDTQTGTWRSSDTDGSLPRLPQARGGMGAVYINGEFWVIGGETPGSTGNANGVYNRIDIFNPVTQTWRLGNPMPDGLHGISPIVAGKKVVTLGGGTHRGFSQSRNVFVEKVDGGAGTPPPPPPPPPPPSPPTPSPPLPSSQSCASRPCSFRQGASCQCDSKCASFGNCCADKLNYCP